MNVGTTFCRNLKRFRAARNLTQAGLAEVVGISEQTIWYYESGKHEPKFEMLGALAKALKVRPWELIADESEGGAVPPQLVEHVAAAARACGLKVSSR